MMTGISENRLDINDCRKTAVINNELKRLNVDIATLQETRLADSGTVKENYYTFVWEGKGPDERRDCDTDHYLVCCKIRLQLKRFHRTKTQGNPRIDVSKMSHPDLVDKFAVAFNEEVVTSQHGDPATVKWETLRDTMHRTSLATFGKKTSKSHDWFEAKSDVMTLLKPSG